MLANKKKKVLFIDRKNELQSQMAECLLDKLHGDVFESYSAGPDYDYVDCEAIAVMLELGHDMRQHMSKNFKALDKMKFDYIVILDDDSKDLPVEDLPPHERLIIHPIPGRECFRATDDKELFDCYASMVGDVESWIGETFVSPESLDSL